MRLVIVAALAFIGGWAWGAAWLLDKIEAARRALTAAQHDIQRLQQLLSLQHQSPGARQANPNFCPVEK